jgi:dTDP-4-amino-4,6-dideoxygalactose transaminase
MTADLEDIDGRYLDRKYCFLVGRGTTAIYIALRAVAQRHGVGEAVLPTMVCPSVVHAVHYTGFVPVFADVKLTDFTMDVASLSARVTERTRAIIPVHLFGHAAAMDEIAAVAAPRRIPIIEDAAMAIGGRLGGKRLGALGDMSILSFGGGKIVSAGGGGAVTTNDEDWAVLLRQQLGKLPASPAPAICSGKELSYRNLCFALIDLLRLDRHAPVQSLFADAAPLYRDLLVHAFPDALPVREGISQGLMELGENAARRVRRASLYDACLDDENLIRSDGWKVSGILWRYSVLVRCANRLSAVTNALRSAGIHASNHYWSVADLCSADADYPNTAFIGPRILNLWADDQATEDYIQRSCEIVRQYAA